MWHRISVQCKISLFFYVIFCKHFFKFRSFRMSSTNIFLVPCAQSEIFLLDFTIFLLLNWVVYVPLGSINHRFRTSEEWFPGFFTVTHKTDVNFDYDWWRELGQICCSILNGVFVFRMRSRCVSFISISKKQSHFTCGDMNDLVVHAYLLH